MLAMEGRTREYSEIENLDDIVEGKKGGNAEKNPLNLKGCSWLC